MPFCSNCGKEIQEGARFCKHCGATAVATGTTMPAPPPPPPPPVYTAAQQVYQEPLKNEGITALVSAIIPGAGQIYVGKVKRGIALLIGNVLLWIVSGVLFWFLAWVPMVALWAWNIYDAYNLAKQYNQSVRATGKPPADWDTAL
jgi:TM2 domain-containing membrane protein YozV